MAVKYNYDEINEALELLRKMKSDCSQSRSYFGTVINQKLDTYLRDYVLKHYGFQKLVNLSSEIEEKLNIYINWLSDANLRAKQVQIKNEEKSEELDDEIIEGGQAQVLYGVREPEIIQENQLVYGPAPQREEEPVTPTEPEPNTPTEPTEPTNPEVGSGDVPQDNPTPTEPAGTTTNEPVSVSGGSSVGTTVAGASGLGEIQEQISSISPKDLSETTTLKDLDETIEKKTTTTTEYQTIPTYTTAQTTSTNRNPSYSTSTKQSASAGTSNGVSKTIVAAGAVGLAGTVAGTGLLIGKKMQSYTFTPNDWDELNQQDQERITNTLYRVGFKDKEINAIMNSTFKISRSELKEHIEKIENASSNYNKFSEEFQKIYNYSIIRGGEVSKYLTFLTMIIDGKSISDQFNMYNIINPYLDDLEEVDKTYQGIRAQDYME